MSNKKISLDEFLMAVDQYRDSRKVNPMDGAMCVYTSTAKSTRHCIFGQIMTDLGHPPAEHWEGQSASLLGAYGTLPPLAGVFRKHDEKAIFSIADTLQGCADGDYIGDGPGQWRTAIKQVESVLIDYVQMGEAPAAALNAWRRVFA